MDLDSLGLVMLFGSDSQMALEDSGFVILETGLDVSELYALFEDHYLSKFTHDSAKNRNLIKSLPMTRCQLDNAGARILEHLGCYRSIRWRPGRLSLTGLQPIPRDRGLGFRFIKTGQVWQRLRGVSFAGCH